MSLCSLVYWENPILSGAVFGSVLGQRQIIHSSFHPFAHNIHFSFNSLIHSIIHSSCCFLINLFSRFFHLFIHSSAFHPSSVFTQANQLILLSVYLSIYISINSIYPSIHLPSIYLSIYILILVYISILVSLISLCYYSLIYVVSNLCLLLLLGVGAVKLYTKGMVMLGKAEQGSDPLSAVSFFSSIIYFKKWVFFVKKYLAASN